MPYEAQTTEEGIDFSGSFWIILSAMLFVIACMALLGAIVCKLI